MRVRLYPTRAAAVAAQRAADTAGGFPRVHAEGSGPNDFAIQAPGAAAARIRARGVRTEHAVDVVASADGTSFGVTTDDTDLDGVDVDAATWFGPPTARGR